MGITILHSNSKYYVVYIRYSLHCILWLLVDSKKLLKIGIIGWTIQLFAAEHGFFLKLCLIRIKLLGLWLNDSFLRQTNEPVPRLMNLTKQRTL